jgi:hypothetical protein
MERPCGYGRALLALGRPAEAIPWLESAIALAEHVRLQLPDVNLRTAYMSETIKIHEALVQAMVAQSGTSAAAAATLEAAEAARGRAMSGQMAEARLRLKDSGLRELMKQEAE